jgi:tRNA threonylcarbamoyl adenosine modification protein (Sua5/YciO/YrdC/YwlC family)
VRTGVFDCSKDDEREEGIVAAVSTVLHNELVVFPTDTVYGVGADAFSAVAVEALLAAKGRDRSMPVPVLVGNQHMVDALVGDMTDVARELIEAFWPGALTLVLKHSAHLAWDLGDTRGTVAVRMPNHEIALELISRTGPLATSSANRSGHEPATTMMEARLQLGAAVSVYLDGGPSGEPLASSIVDLTGDRPRVLRAGAIDVERLREIAPDVEGVEGAPAD